MTRQIIDLGSDPWQFGQVPRRPFTAPAVYDLPAVTDWHPATVPGNVRPDLLALGRIPDPFFGSDYTKSLWVEAVDWWYRREIQTGPLLPSQRAFLIFEGIDYRSAIFIDGREMARHEGMFSRQIIEISEALRQGAATVAVRLWGSSALPRRQINRRQWLWQKIATPLYGSWAGIYPDRSATLKCQMSFGWDFAPPLRPMGIWDDVSLVICGPVFIRGAALRSGDQALSLELTLDSSQPCSLKTIIQLTPTNFDGASFGPFVFDFNIGPGNSHHALTIPLPEAALWQPWDRGHPNLYDVEITVAAPNGKVFDQTTTRTGLRRVDLARWQFRLNGQREFMRGVNWVPADCFPGRLRRQDYARLLTKVRVSGANLLRVWGGGLREKRAFYDLCDEMGLLVWQEFPFACLFLGSYPRDQAYLRQVEAECRAIVRQVSHHPSLIAWCGGNEFSYRRNQPLLQTLAEVVEQNDGTRPFISVSPSHFDGGDAHNWHVWHGNAPFRAYQAETARFLSEFGLQALPSLQSLQSMLPDPTQGWATHRADPDTLRRYTKLFLEADASSADVSISRLPSFITASQRAQATALQTAIEHMRRRKGITGGVCLWQFNEPWPAISWAIVDYFGRPKLASERLKTWYHPLLISLKFPIGQRWRRGDYFEAEIWAINDTLRPYQGCHLQVDLDGRLIHAQTIDLLADSAVRVGQLAHRLTHSPRRLTLTLHRHLNVLAQNRYDLDWADQTRISLYRRFRRWVADWVLR